MDAIDKINAILKERGMTGADLSREIGVSTAVYSQWNKKKTKPSNKNLLKVANALEVPISELAEKEKPPAQSGEPIGPNKQALLNLVDTMSEDEMGALLEIVQATLKMRDKK